MTAPEWFAPADLRDDQRARLNKDWRDRATRRPPEFVTLREAFERHVAASDAVSLGYRDHTGEDEMLRREDDADAAREAVWRALADQGIDRRLAERAGLIL